MTRILCCILWFGSICFAQGARILIVTDLEGAGGVNDADEQLLPGQRRYMESRRILTGEVNAAVEGAIAAGASEVVIWDGHDGSRTLSVDEIHGSAKLLQGDRLQPTTIFQRSSTTAFSSSVSMPWREPGRACWLTRRAST